MRKFKPMRSLTIALVVVLALMASARAATTVTLSASPTQGISPVSIALTWSSTEAAVCTAGGAWSGSKAVAGTETVVARVDSTYSLTCSTSTGSATASWTAPTQNTDGSAIPAAGKGSLASFKLFHAPTAAGLLTATPVVIANPAVRSRVITGLPVGQRFYALTAVNAEGIESDLSASAQNVIVLPSASATASVVVNVKPLPPLVTVAQTVFDLRSGRVNKLVGSIPLGEPCGAYVATRNGNRFYAVPKSAVDFDRQPRSARVVAKCRRA